MSAEYDDFVRMTASIEAGLKRLLDADDFATVDEMVTNIAIQLGEIPERWHGAGNLALMVSEALIGPSGPWEASPAELRANTIMACFVLVRLMAHPLMQPVLKSWEQDHNNRRGS